MRSARCWPAGCGSTGRPAPGSSTPTSGYAILGRVVAAAPACRTTSSSATRLLAPLGMTRTGFDAAEFTPASSRPATGAAPRGWAELPFDPYGAFAPMGGVFSWWPTSRVVGRVRGGVPAGRRLRRAGSRAPHPLRRASRREMQLPQAVTGWRSPDRLPGGPPAVAGVLRVRAVRRRGSGARPGGQPQRRLPGVRSNMRWHPATGLGVIALGNGTYAPMSAGRAWCSGPCCRARRLPRGAGARGPRLAAAPSATPVPTGAGGAVAGDAGGRDAVNRLLWRTGTTRPRTRCSARTSRSTPLPGATARP